jgi:thiaminase/transcriptional activator TenA
VNKSFSDELKHQTIDNWNRILSHNFIVEMAKDILPISKFVFYLKQDQIFLESLSKLLATASRIAYDRQTKTWFESLLDSTTRYEMPMQLEIINLLEDDLKSSGVSQEKTTQNYVSHLERVSNSDDLAMMLSAMAPCPWTYYEISQASIREDIKSEVFKKWLGFYSSVESLKQVNQIKEQLDKLGNNADEKKRIEMKNHFSISCNYELKFWDMAYSYRK